MAFCSNCGAQLKDGAKFCSECGEKVILKEDISNIEVNDNNVKDEMVVSEQESYNKEISIDAENKKDFIKIDKDLLKKIIFMGSGLVLIVLLIILIKPLFSNDDNNDSVNSSEVIPEYINFSWNDIVLKDKVPNFGERNGLIHYNSGISFNVEFFASSNEFNEYVLDCKDMGFTIDLEEYSSSYSAYNNDGYSLILSYTSGLMKVKLESPMELGTFTWPNNELTKLLPDPETNLGKIELQSEDVFIAYLGNYPMDKYNNYVDKVIDKGFDTNMIRYGKTFSANKTYLFNEYSVLITYQGFDIINLWITKTNS